MVAPKMAESWYRYDPLQDLLTLSVHVQPNARVTGFDGLHDGRLRIRIAAPPIEARANALLIDFLKKTFALRGDRVIIRHGLRGRAKIVQIASPGPALLARLEQPL